MWYGHTVSVVFPALNEAANIAHAVHEFLSVETAAGKRLVDEILVVDNGSTDGTADLARRAGAVVVHEPQRGYGNALRCGLQFARSDLVVIAEPDGTFVARDMVRLCAYGDSFEMVCGTRTTRELIWSGANMSWPMRAGNIVLAKTLEVLYGTPSLSDCGCTFRLIHREALHRILPDLHVGGSHFLPSMIVAARMHGVSLIEVPVTYRARVGTSKITGSLDGTLRTGFRMAELIATSWPTFLRSRIRKPVDAGDA